MRFVPTALEIFTSPFHVPADIDAHETCHEHSIHSIRSTVDRVADTQRHGDAKSPRVGGPPHRWTTPKVPTHHSTLLPPLPVLNTAAHARTRAHAHAQAQDHAVGDDAQDPLRPLAAQGWYSPFLEPALTFAQMQSCPDLPCSPTSASARQNNSTCLHTATQKEEAIANGRNVGGDTDSHISEDSSGHSRPPAGGRRGADADRCGMEDTWKDALKTGFLTFCGT